MKRLIILSAVVLLLLLSCNQSGYGVYYTIKNEKPLTDGTLPNEMSIDCFVATSTDYYICTGSVYTRTIADAELTSAEWVKLKNTPPEDTFRICIGLGVVSDQIYALFFDDNDGDESYTIYYNDGSGTGSSTWHVPDLGTLQADAEISAMYEAGGYIFALIKESDSSYSLWYSDGSVVPDLNFVDTGYDFNYPVIDVEYSGATYYFMTSLDVHYTTSPAGTYNTYSASLGTSNDKDIFEFTGLGIGLGGEIMVTAKLLVDDLDSALLRYNSTNWTIMAYADDEDDILSDVMEITIDTQDVTLVCSSSGYYEIDSAATDDDLIKPDDGITTSSSYASLDLRTYHINDFYYQGTGDVKLYALTNNNGLWRLILDPLEDHYKDWTCE